MKKAFSTVTCLDMSMTEIIEHAKRAGIDTLEVRLDRQGNFMGYPLENIAEAKAILDKEGISIRDIGTSCGFRSYAPEMVAKFNSCIDIAAAVGAKGLRVFLGTGYKKHSDKVVCDYEGMVKSIRESCDYAAPLGVQVWAETHNDFSKGTVLAKLIKDVARDNFKIIWDLIHPYELGESAEETIEALGDNIAHVHIKDGRRNPDLNMVNYIYTKLGEGELPIADMVWRLINRGYDGYFSLEWENEWRAELKGVYCDLDKLLSDFNFFMKSIEKNLLPRVSSDEWTTFAPKFKEIVDFSKNSFASTLEMKLESATYGTGKWLAEAEVEVGKTYDFAVAVDTDAKVNDVYVVYSVLGAKSGYALRDHAINSNVIGNRIMFSDKITVPQSGDAKVLKIRIELWLKGYYSYARYYQPLLSEGEPLAPRRARVAIAYISPKECKMNGKGTSLTFLQTEKLILDNIDECGKQNPDIIVLSECMYERGAAKKNQLDGYETVKGYMVTKVREKAAEYKSYIVYNFHEIDAGEYYNTSILIGRDGSIVGKYRKTHLTVTELERGLAPGESYPVFDTDFGRVGMLICYDHYFAEPTEKLAEAGAELVCVSTAGDASFKSIARAMDSASYYAICGWNNENDMGWGAGRIINPAGEILADTDETYKPAVADIDFSLPPRRSGLSTGASSSRYDSVYKYNRHELKF